MATSNDSPSSPDGSATPDHSSLSSEAASSHASRRHVDAPRRPGVVWDDSAMKCGYANVCNVTSTREEVIVVFGTNRGTKGPGEPVTVALSDKMILSPFAAKRLSRLLNGVIEDYEQRFGPLVLGPVAASRGSEGQ